MPHAYGYRAGTRHLFSRGFRKHGVPNLSTFMIKYKKGDYVLVQGRLKISKKQQSKSDITKTASLSTKEYHLNVFKMSLICRP